MNDKNSLLNQREAAQQKLQKIISSPSDWRDFLEASAPLYKYPFTEQVYIHSQNEKATAVASVEIWNKLGRFVKEDEQAIVIPIVLEDDTLSYRYLFDIVSTENAREVPRHISPWQVTRRNIESIEATFSDVLVDGIYLRSLGKERSPDIKDILPSQIRRKVESIVNDRFDIYFDDLSHQSEDSFFADLPVEAQENIYKNLLIDSSTYLICQRAGYIAEESIPVADFAFDEIYNFNTNDIIVSVGTVISDINQDVLKIIEKEVIKQEKLQKMEKESVQHEEGNQNNGQRSGISERGGLLDTSDGSPRPARGLDREVRNDETGLHEGTPPGDLPKSSDERRTETIFDGLRPAVQGTDRPGTGEPTKKPRNNRRIKSKRPTGVGGADEQRPAFGRRDSAAGDYVQLSLFSSPENQIEQIKERENSLSFNFTLEEQEEIHVPPSAEKAVVDKIEKNVDFRIDDLDVATGKKAKYQDNVAAIKLLQDLESSDQLGTAAEQAVLSKYVGWGGLQEAFDGKNSSWKQEYAELKSILSEQDYETARASVLNAHYTPPIIIESIYDALQQNGFDGGRILEPAMGTGHFFGKLPEGLKSSDLYGVELDNITGKIAQQLYPSANIEITGFEKTQFPNDYFDTVVGNVPFGDYSVNDPDYKQKSLMIHDYFILKSIDKVKPQGIVAVITTSGTLDKKSSSIREEFARKADLVGAIRLPNDTFLKNAGTKVTTDILFFQKRDEPMQELPAWINVSENKNGIVMNNYFIDNPNMIVGTMEIISGRFGNEFACLPKHRTQNGFKAHLAKAIQNIDFDIAQDSRELVEAYKPLPNNFTDIPNQSYFIDNDVIRYKNGVNAEEVKTNPKSYKKLSGLVYLRDALRHLIKLQLDSASPSVIQNVQEHLTVEYDNFTKEFGYISDATNKRSFVNDSSYHLLCSLEKLDENNKVIGRADIFDKVTILPKKEITTAETPTEALAISLSELGRVELDYMAALLDGKMSKKEILSELKGAVFLDPETETYQTNDEYLSGNVREKLEYVKSLADADNRYSENIAYLEQVQPIPLTSNDIDIRMGATWIEAKFYHQFLLEYLNISKVHEDNILLEYNDILNQWSLKVTAPHLKALSVVNTVKGTKRRDAFGIFIDSINLKNVQIFDTVIEDGKEKRIFNPKQTAMAIDKQDQMKDVFTDWVFKDPERREHLCSVYNEKFNSTRVRTFDGSHLTFPGMNTEFKLRDHQKNAVARSIFGGNSLYGHVVGAGKTYAMAAAAMEMKRIGLANKSLFVVPSYLTVQWGNDFRKLYPGANLLVADKNSFSTDKRKQFCSRIATGNYDAVIIGHSQFGKIPLSKERQSKAIRKQIYDVTNALDSATDGTSITIKQLESLKKRLNTKLEKLNNQDSKDSVITFEELGVDRLFVDEAHSFKNLYLYTKMRNVAGIGQTEAQKSSDMFNKCQYMDEITDNKGICFATGTPISNSMVELYTMQRYLMHDELENMDLSHFDSWASTFGETTTAIELAPEGTGYRMKTRFSKFFNLPELMKSFTEVADIQTSDLLDLETPTANYHNVVIKPSDFQKEMVLSFADRAKAVRNRSVEPKEDNMLKITGDGRKLALDQRLANEMLPADENGKIPICAEKVFDIWQKNTEKQGTQLIFCDIATPKKLKEGELPKFSAYGEMKRLLLEKGIPEKDIAFIHDADDDKAKSSLFKKVTKGEIRILMGSTSKMGAGMNVQEKLVALHHLDVPWKPSDIEQQEGRILRQGNENPEVDIFKYVTEGTFDAYSWQLIENKQKFISQVMTSKTPSRSCDDVDESVLSYAEIKALATGDPRIKEKMDLDIEVSKLKLNRSNFQSGIYEMQDKLIKTIPVNITRTELSVSRLEKAVSTLSAHSTTENTAFNMTVKSFAYTERLEAGKSVIEACKGLDSAGESTKIAEFRGFSIEVRFNSFEKQFVASVKDTPELSIPLSTDPSGNITRITNMLDKIPSLLMQAKERLANLFSERESLKKEVAKIFPKEIEYQDKSKKLSKLNSLLSKENTQDKQTEKEAER